MHHAMLLLITHSFLLDAVYLKRNILDMRQTSISKGQGNKK